MDSHIVHKALSDKVLAMAFSVHRSLGPGLLEAVYEGAFAVELAHNGIAYEQQQVFPVTHRGEYVGAYFADLVVANAIIVELKSVTKLNEVMVAQLLN